MWKYTEIKNLKEAKKYEEVCAVYPNPYNNVAGKKSEKKIKKAALDAKHGKCKLVVFREQNKETE